MAESNQEGYQTLEWIINKSESGLFLVVADRAMQQEIVSFFRQGEIGIYDYKEYPYGYSFQNLERWLDSQPEIQTFLIVNFQLAVQKGEDLKRLNFSRDMLAGLGKNLIFFTTQSGDDRLAVSAYDFYSFIKIRVIFRGYTEERNVEIQSSDDRNDFIQKREVTPKEAREKIKETYDLLKQAEEAELRAEYRESEKLLLKAKAIREALLGTEHLETARVYQRLAIIYGCQELYKQAEKFGVKALKIYEKVLGESHPDTADSYNNLANLYREQGKSIDRYRSNDT